MLLIGASACGRTEAESDEAGCLLLGWGIRQDKEDTVRIDFGLDHLTGVHVGDIVHVWSTEERLGTGPRRLLSVGTGSAKEAPFIIYSEPGSPAKGGIYVDAGLPACASLQAPTLDGGPK